MTVLHLSISCPFTGRRKFDSANGDAIIPADPGEGFVSVNPVGETFQVQYPFHAVIAVRIDGVPQLTMARIMPELPEEPDTEPLPVVPLFPVDPEKPKSKKRPNKS